MEEFPLGDTEPGPNPHDTAFKQQALPVWEPKMTPKWVLATYISVAILFIPLGAGLLSISRNVTEVEVRYDNLPDCQSRLGNASTPCDVTLDIPKDMPSPVYVYYKLTNFYQNHRSYVKSRSGKQLRAEASKASQLTDCAPLVRYGDAFDGADLNLTDKILYPCGLIANSFFTDSFANPCVKVQAGNPCVITNLNEQGIAWSSDLKRRFIPMDLDSEMTRSSPRGFELPVVNNEHFIVWMRTAALPTFHKLYGKLEIDLSEGSSVKFSVKNLYKSTDFNGGKYLVLSTMSNLGGKNDFLGITFLVVGFISLGVGLVFFTLNTKCVNKPLLEMRLREQ